MQIGKTHTLKAARTTENGCYLMDAAGNEVLLPNIYVREDLKLGDEISVFVYLDNEERPVATTLKPRITLDHFCLFRGERKCQQSRSFHGYGSCKTAISTVQ